MGCRVWGAWCGADPYALRLRLRLPLRRASQTPPPWECRPAPPSSHPNTSRARKATGYEHLPPWSGYEPVVPWLKPPAPPHHDSRTDPPQEPSRTGPPRARCLSRWDPLSYFPTENGSTGCPQACPESGPSGSEAGPCGSARFRRRALHARAASAHRLRASSGLPASSMNLNTVGPQQIRGPGSAGA